MMVAAHRIGPNAITQVARALQQSLGAAAAGDLVRGAGLGGYLLRPPQEMVDEREVIALHAAVRARLPPAAAHKVLRDAGLQTAEYLLAHRIPKGVQSLLRRLPPGWAGWMLLAAIRRHAWTFAGSGRFSARAGHPVRVAIENNPICRGTAADAPVCIYYAATFERLFQRLVHPRARVIETDCLAAGAALCRFEISWD